MEPIKRYEILESLPVYGPMHITITPKGKGYYSEGLVVRFYKSDGTDWVANFQPGWTGLDGIYALQGGQTLLVIASGTCYVMNPDFTKPISAFGFSFESIFFADDGRYVLQDMCDVTVVEQSGEYWDSERISWDGMKDLQLEGNVISGLSWYPMSEEGEWVAFTFNIDTRRLIGGSWRK